MATGQDLAARRHTAAGHLVISFGLAAVLVASLAATTHAGKAKTQRMTVGTGGTEVAAGGQDPAISATGQFVAFRSSDANIVGNDTNGKIDVFIHNRKSRKTRRVSVRTDGGEAVGGTSDHPSVSGDGRFVAFESRATNLVNGDNNLKADIFVRDRKKKRTKRVSVRSNGAEAIGGDSSNPVISTNGRFVAFWSRATNLVSGDTNAVADVFVHDRKKKRTRRVSIRSNGSQANGGSTSPSISADGRYVAFQSAATDLVKNDGNGATDVFVHDRKTRKTRRVSVSSNGAEAFDTSTKASISGNGRFVAFESLADTLVGGDTNNVRDVFIHDRQKRRTKIVSLRSNGKQGGGTSDGASVSASGRFVAFSSRAENLVRNDDNDVIDVFIRDRKAKKTRRVSVSSSRAQAVDGDNDEPAISADGRFVAFWSDAVNLIKNDGNGSTDVFRRGPLR